MVVVGAAVVVGAFLEAEQASEWGSKTREMQAMIIAMTLLDGASMVTAATHKVNTWKKTNHGQIHGHIGT